MSGVTSDPARDDGVLVVGVEARRPRAVGATGALAQPVVHGPPEDHGQEVRAGVRSTTPDRVRPPASSTYVAGCGRSSRGALEGGRYAPSARGRPRPGGGGPSRTSTAFALLKTWRQRSPEQLGGRPDSADLRVAGHARPDRSVAPGERAHQRVGAELRLGLQRPRARGRAGGGRARPASARGSAAGRRAPPRSPWPTNVVSSIVVRALDRTGQRLAVEQREVLEEAQPPGLGERLVGEALAEDHVGARRRTSHVYPEAQDAVDL